MSFFISQLPIYLTLNVLGLMRLQKEQAVIKRFADISNMSLNECMQCGKVLC